MPSTTRIMRVISPGAIPRATSPHPPSSLVDEHGRVGLGQHLGGGQAGLETAHAVGDGEGEHDAFVRGLKPRYLAEHLVGRWRSLGTTLEAFCCDCGDEVVAMPEDDPVCAKCQLKRDAWMETSQPQDAADRSAR